MEQFALTRHIIHFSGILISLYCFSFSFCILKHIKRISICMEKHLTLFHVLSFKRSECAFLVMNHSNKQTAFNIYYTSCPSCHDRHQSKMDLETFIYSNCLLKNYETLTFTFRGEMKQWKHEMLKDLKFKQPIPYPNICFCREKSHQSSTFLSHKHVYFWHPIRLWVRSLHSA